MFKRVDNVQTQRKIFSLSTRELKWFLIGVILWSIVGCENGRPVAAGPILTSSNIPLIDTVYESGGSVLVTNSGNADATIISVAADAGVSNLLGCSDMTLAPAESCTISFNVTESGGYATLAVAYSGISGTNALYTLISWYNSRGFALASMSASNNPLSFGVGQTGTSTVTITNIGGYTLKNIVIPTPVILSGSATANISANTCTEPLAINASCSYNVEVTDNYPEQYQQINLGFSAEYAGPNGATVYKRSLLLSYSSLAI
jgi:hypothetical protein